MLPITTRRLGSAICGSDFDMLLVLNKLPLLLIGSSGFFTWACWSLLGLRCHLSQTFRYRVCWELDYAIKSCLTFFLENERLKSSFLGCKIFSYVHDDQVLVLLACSHVVVLNLRNLKAQVWRLVSHLKLKEDARVSKGFNTVHFTQLIPRLCQNTNRRKRNLFTATTVTMERTYLSFSTAKTT